MRCVSAVHSKRVVFKMRGHDSCIEQGCGFNMTSAVKGLGSCERREAREAQHFSPRNLVLCSMVLHLRAGVPKRSLFSRVEPPAKSGPTILSLGSPPFFGGDYGRVHVEALLLLYCDAYLQYIVSG